MPEQRVRLREKDLARVRAIAEKRNCSETEVLSDAIKKIEVKKVAKEKQTEDEDQVYECDECEEEIPADAAFCPYCGVEFEPDEESEDDSSEEE